MIYRRFGRTGQNVSALSLGLMRSMHSWQDTPLAEIPAESQSRLETLVRSALDRGINHLETARGYGSSERQLGRILAAIPRERYLLQTKIRPLDDSDLFLSHFHDSLERLQLDRVDFLSIHGLNDYRSLWQACRKGGCLAVARRLQEQGLVGAVGFSGHGFTDVLLEAVCFPESGGFDYCNLHWYMIFQRHQRVLEEAAARDMGVFVISPTDKGGMLWNPPQQLVELSDPFYPMRFNDLFCLNNPHVHTISVGASSPEDLDEHLIAVSELPGSSAGIDAVRRRWEQAMRGATGSIRPDSDWDRFPPWELTPGHINIPFILWLYNLARGWGMVEFGRYRYKGLGRDMPWVPGNNAESVRQYDLGRVAQRSGWDEQRLKDTLEAAHRLLGGDGS